MIADWAPLCSILRSGPALIYYSENLNTNRETFTARVKYQPPRVIMETGITLSMAQHTIKGWAEFTVQYIYTFVNTAKKNLIGVCTDTHSFTSPICKSPHVRLCTLPEHIQYSRFITHTLINCIKTKTGTILTYRTKPLVRIQKIGFFSFSCSSSCSTLSYSDFKSGVIWYWACNQYKEHRFNFLLPNVPVLCVLKKCFETGSHFWLISHTFSFL